jgi:hypothetical protein
MKQGPTASSPKARAKADAGKALSETIDAVKINHKALLEKADVLKTKANAAIGEYVARRNLKALYKNALEDVRHSEEKAKRLKGMLDKATLSPEEIKTIGEMFTGHEGETRVGLEDTAKTYLNSYVSLIESVRGVKEDFCKGMRRIYDQIGEAWDDPD